MNCQGWRLMGRATELPSAERRCATRRAGVRTGRVKNCESGDELNVSRRRDDEERRMDDAVEKLLLELADYAFSVMRVVRVRVRPARVAYGSNA
jgi:hypothetical protein